MGITAPKVVCCVLCVVRVVCVCVCVCVCVYVFVLLTLLTQGGKYLSPPKQMKSLISVVCVCVWPPTFLIPHEKDVHVNISVYLFRWKHRPFRITVWCLCETREGTALLIASVLGELSYLSSPGFDTVRAVYMHAFWIPEACVCVGFV